MTSNRGHICYQKVWIIDNETNCGFYFGKPILVFFTLRFKKVLRTLYDAKDKNEWFWTLNSLVLYILE